MAEEAGTNNQIVTQRRGAAVIKLTIKGKPAHSGVDAELGVNAIEELTFKINLFAFTKDYIFTY